ncbi:MAG TPA: NADH-quinone oxidoreductase subunit L [Symbiobacteriaceae bacterium]|nr:NADH-quinone oxidoreductase subunit L [Symbiobacteriaceae bacterium]
MSLFLPAIILLPLLSAAVLGFFRNSWSKQLISVVSCSAVGASFLMVLALLFKFNGTHEPIHAVLTSWGPILPEFGLVADSLSLWWMVVVTGAGLLIHIYSTGYMVEDLSFGRFMAKLNFFIYAMSLLVLSDNFGGLLMGWANVGLASYMLIGFYFKKPSASAASMKAFVINMIGEAGMIAGIAFIYANYGTLKFTEVFDAIKEGGTPLFSITLIGLLLLMGAAAKSAQFPLHTWLPNAMEGPTPVSALIHAATMVTAGVYLVSRVYPIYEASHTAALTVAWIGAIGALGGSLIALGQTDIKRILAFSTLSQVGYMFLGNGLGAYVAADFHFLTHAFFKAALFLGAGIVVHHYNGDQDIRRMGGLWQKDKFAGWVFLIGALALIGLPPFAGFFSKDEILAAAWDHNKVLFVIGLAGAAMTAIYNTRLFALVFLGKPYEAPKAAAAKKGKKHDDHGHDAHGHDHDHHHATPKSMSVPVGILTFLSVVAGAVIFMGHTQVHFLEHSFEQLHLEAEPINWLVAGLSIVIALAGIGIGMLLYGPNGKLRAKELDLNAKGGALLNMLYVDQIYAFLFVQPVRDLAEVIGVSFDPKGVDGVVNGLGESARLIGSDLRALQSGHTTRYIASIFVGVVLVLAYFVLVI